MREYTGVDLPNLIGCTVRIDQGAMVVGVIDRVETEGMRNDVYFSRVNKDQTVWHGKDAGKKLINTAYFVFDDSDVFVLELNKMEPEQDSELVLFFADILCEYRTLGSPSVNAQDLRQAREVVKAMEALVNADSKE